MRNIRPSLYQTTKVAPYSSIYNEGRAPYSSSILSKRIPLYIIPLNCTNLLGTAIINKEQRFFILYSKQDLSFLCSRIAYPNPELFPFPSQITQLFQIQSYSPSVPKRTNSFHLSR